MASGISPPPPMMAASAATMLASAYATQTEVDQSGGGNLELSQEPNTTDPVESPHDDGVFQCQEEVHDLTSHGLHYQSKRMPKLS